MASSELRYKVIGSIASFKSADALPIDSLKVHFLPIQEGMGDPSPSNIRPITGWTRLNIHHTGKNIFNPNCDMFNFSTTYTINSDGSITQLQSDGRGWAEDNRFVPIFMKAGTYRISCSDNGTINLRTSLDNYDQNTSLSNGGGSFTLSSDCYIRFKHTKNSSASYPVTFNIQIEIDSLASSYESYHGTTIPVTIPDGGKYGGYIDLVTGDFIKAYEIVDLGTLNYTYDSTNFQFVCYSGINFTERTSMMCSNYKNSPVSQWTSMEDKTFSGHPTDGTVFRIKDTDYTDAMTFKAAMSGVKLVYKLNTPVTIATQTSIQLKTFIGQNHIWSDANGEIECIYQFVDYLNLRRMSLNEPHTGMSGDPIAYFNTDLNSKLINIKSTFDPVQSGTGDPSPSNVRPITGWTGLNIHHTGQNLLNYNEIMDTNVGTDINGDRKAVKFTKAGTYYVKSFNTWSSESYIYARVKNADDTFGNIIYVVAKTTVTNKTITIMEGQTLYVFNASSGVYGTTEATVDRFNGWGIVVSLEDLTEYVAPIGSVYPSTFPVQGKNLLDVTKTDSIVPGASGSTITISNGVVSIDAVATSARSYVKFSQVFPAGTYTIQALASGSVLGGKILADVEFEGSLYNSYYSAYTKSLNGTSSALTFTLPAASKIGLCLPNKTGESGSPGSLYNIQLELGSTATTYEPYTNTIYGGYVDLITGNLVSTYNKITVDGSEDSWYYTSYSGKDYARVNIPTGINFGYSAKSRGNIFFSYGKKSSGYNLWNGFISSVNDNILFYIPSTIESKNDWLEYLSEHPLDVVYELATPITYQLTPVQLKAFIGDNYIWADANGETTVKYWTHII